MTNLEFGVTICGIAVVWYGWSRIRARNRDGNPNKDFEQIQTRRGGLRQGDLDTQAIIEAKDVESIVKIMEKQVPGLNTSSPEYRNLTPEKKMEKITAEVNRRMEKATGLSMENIYKRAGLGVGEKPETTEENINVLKVIYEGTLEASSVQAQSGTWGDAEDAFKKRDYATAYRISRPLAEQGNAMAQEALGFMYDKVNSASKYKSEAVKWYRMAAEQGHAAAQFRLGFKYEKGEGVPKDMSEAVKWYRKAAELGHPTAQCNLGFKYDNGEGVPQDISEAVKWYRKAAEQGDAFAQLNLGVKYDNGKDVPQDISEAVKWYRKAAEQGDATAQCRLGTMYYLGNGVPEVDYILAKMWLDLGVSRISESHIKETLVSLIDDIASEMTPVQIAESQRMVQERMLKS